MGHLFTETSHAGRGQEDPGVVFHKYINPTGEGSSRWPHHLPKASLDAILLEAVIPHMNWGGDTY